MRLVGAVLAEQRDEWAEGRRYLGPEVLNRGRLVLVPAAAEEEVKPKTNRRTTELSAESRGITRPDSHTTPGG